MKPTQEQVIAWAREAGFYGSEILGDHEYDVVGLVSDLERFAALAYEAARKDENEACANVCDRFQERDVGMQPAECAGAIRARREQ